MFIKIDCRESDFMTNMNLLFKEHSHEIQLESLPLGDIILLNKENSEKVIFERKSLYDLASSIKDGRYSEQSFRLNQCKIHNHNIIYIIEGDFEKYNPKKGRMDKNKLSWRGKECWQVLFVFTDARVKDFIGLRD